MINENFYFVDLPGYGYAKVSKTMRADWGIMAEEYLSERAELKLSIQLIDSRHEPTKLDKQLNEWLIFNKKNHIVVATKADKLSTNNLNKNLKVIKTAFRESKIIAYSSENGLGKDAVWQEIHSSLEKT